MGLLRASGGVESPVGPSPEQPSSFGHDQNKLRSFLPCLLVFAPAGDQVALRGMGSGCVCPGPPLDPTDLAGDPEAVALSLQTLAGEWRHPSRGAVFTIKGDNTCKLLGTWAGTSPCKLICYYHHRCHGYLYYRASYCGLLSEEPVGASGSTWLHPSLADRSGKGQTGAVPQEATSLAGLGLRPPSAFSVVRLELRLTGLEASVEAPE